MSQEQVLRKPTKSCDKYPTITDLDKPTIDRFTTAYAILAETCYIPETHRKGFAIFLRRAAIPTEHMPTKIRILRHKIELDQKLEVALAEIYKVLNLADI